MSDQQDSDGLPYTQVDRAAKPKAAMLAACLGVTYQHGIGGLVEFWDLCGDPRDLERLILAGVDKVVLSAGEIESRFEMGFGRPLPVAKLVSLGLAAKDGDGYRVRGMSRYFKPVRDRLQRRMAAVAGGKASAAKRATTVSPGPNSVEESLNGRPTVVQPEFNEMPSGSTIGSTVVQPESNTADSGQRSSKRKKPLRVQEPFKLEPVGPPAKEPRKESQAEDWFSLAVEGERRHKLVEDGADPDHVVPLAVAENLTPPFINAAVKRLKEASGLALLRADDPNETVLADVYGAYLEDPKNAGLTTAFSFRYFTTEGVWRKYLDQLKGEAA